MPDFLDRENVVQVMPEVMNRLARAYDGRHILVAGGASFIGSHLSELLVQSGAKVTVADDLSSGKRGNLDTIASKIIFLEGDLRALLSPSTSPEVFRSPDYRPAPGRLAGELKGAPAPPHVGPTVSKRIASGIVTTCIVNRRSACRYWRLATDSIEGERVEGQYKLIETRYFLVSDKTNRAVPKTRGARSGRHSLQGVRLCAKF